VSPSAEVAGYLFAWLASSFGQTLLARERFGSVILVIDQFQLAELPLPWLANSDSTIVSKLVLEANDLRTSAWNHEQKAPNRLDQLIAPNGASTGS
jgi:type I restriction enzyme S subunit